MDFTISSVITTCVFVSILALIFIALFKNDLILKSIGPQCMIIVFVAIIIRMFVPFEFGYTHSIRVEEVLPVIRRILTASAFVGNHKIQVWQILCLIWGIGIIVSIVHKFISYYRVKHYISLFPQTQWEKLCEQYDFEFTGYGDISEVRLFFCEAAKAPCVMGVIKPYLFVPDLSYEKEQLRYIIMHELMHVKNHDIVWKILIDVLCTVFWWNPVFGYLKKELFRLIEMHNDMEIISVLPEEEQVQYMECLKDVALRLSGKEVAFGVPFSISDFNELKRRMLLIADKNKFNRWKQALVVAVMGIGLFVSTAFILEPHSLLSEEEAGGIPLTADNTYLIINQDSYDVYVDGMYLFNTDDLTPFPGVKIYESLEDVPKAD